MKQIICGVETQIGLAMAQLFANNTEIAKALPKTALKCMSYGSEWILDAILVSCMFEFLDSTYVLWIWETTPYNSTYCIEVHGEVKVLNPVEKRTADNYLVNETVPKTKLEKHKGSSSKKTGEEDTFD